MTEQLGIAGIEPAPVTGKQPNSNLVHTEKLRLFARLLVQGFTDDGKAVHYQWQAAYFAGIGADKDSASTLSSRYLDNPIVKAEMSLHRARLEGEGEANRAEVFGYWRQLYQENTGARKVRVPMTDPEGNVSGFVETYQYRPDLAEKVVEKMARAAKVLDDGKNTVVAGAPVIIAASAEGSAEDWAQKYGRNSDA